MSTQTGKAFQKTIRLDSISSAIQNPVLPAKLIILNSGLTVGPGAPTQVRRKKDAKSKSRTSKVSDMTVISILKESHHGKALDRK